MRRKPIIFPRDRRAEPRIRTFLRGKLAFGHSQSTIPCVIRDISLGGAMIETEAPLFLPGEVFLLNIQEAVVYEAKIIWRDENRIGLQFNAIHQAPAPEGAQARGLRLLWSELAPR